MPHLKLACAVMTAVVAVTFGHRAIADEQVETAAPAPLFPDSNTKQISDAPKTLPMVTEESASGWKPVPQRVPEVQQAPQRISYAQQESTPPAAIPTGGPARITNGYPYLNAPMSPTPRPDIPYQAGGSYITNQALFPHEMLYPHTYEAMYPPFYYKSRGRITMTRDGIRVKEKWKLQGTKVKVKYRSFIGLGTLFKTPFHRTGTRWR